jgi:hypothetical protein
MVRRFGLFLLVIAVMLAALTLPAALTPTPAEASINSIVWLDTAYKGYDPLLDTYVQAYEAGSTATLAISLQNTTGDDMEIKGAKVNFDWTDGEYTAAAGGYPATLASNQSGTALISFTVPEVSVASNQFAHRYTVSVDYDREGGQKVGERVTGEVEYAYGGQTHFYLSHGPIDPTTVAVLVNETPRTDYTVDCDSQSITFTSGLADDAKVAVDYTYVEYVGTGDGEETLFQLDHPPVVPGTVKVFVDCTLTSAYAVDADTGEIEFSTPPADDRSVIADYQYRLRWSESGDDFAVYSSDQTAAMAVKQQLTAIGSPGVATAGSRELLAKSAMEEQLGDQEYAAGNLDNAKAHYDQAFTYMDKALKNDKDPNTFKLLEPTGTLLLGIGMVLLALGVIVFVLKRPKGPSNT